MTRLALAVSGPSNDVSHDAYQSLIVQTAHLMGWHTNHVRRSIGKGHRWTTTTSRVGMPDLHLWHPTLGMAFIEVKVGRDKPTSEQRQVLTELEAAGAQVLVAYPADWPRVVELLNGVTT